VPQVGYLLELYRDARSPKYKILHQRVPTDFQFASKIVKDIYVYPVLFMSVLAPSNVAKIFMLVILNDFCLVPE